MGHRMHLDQRSVCCIRVHGTIGQHWREYFQGLAISTDNEARHSVTTLNGELPDQASLMGVITGLYQMGHALISVECKPCRDSATLDFSADRRRV